MTSSEVEIDGRRLKLSNLEKVLYPEAGFSKAEVIDYYVRVSPVVLPHLRDRPLTLKRYPDGVDSDYFYEKSCPSHRPEWVRTARIRTTGSSRWGASGQKAKAAGSIDYCVVDDLPTLVWVANLASLELHTPMHTSADSTIPRMMVFDLDPGEGATIVECAQVALWLRDLFGDLSLEGFAKTSGSKGLQVYVPLNGDDPYDVVTPFTKAVAELLEREHRDLVVSRQDKTLRRNKVLIDWSQNVEAKTTVSVYSLRARAQPTVSTPVAWDEVADTADSGDAARLVFDAPAVLERVERLGDLFAPVLELRQPLPAAVTS